jgi:nitroreductase
MTDLDQLGQLIRSRRTSMLVDNERAVPHDLIEQLCELAQWAPNHKRTWPWRFAVVEGPARATLGNVIADRMEAMDDPPDKAAKTRGKYLRTPMNVVVGAAHGDSPTRTAENRDAGAAGVQNFLLAATAAGLATFWGSCPKGANDAVAEWCGFADQTFVVALIYVGWASTAVAAPERPAPPITYLG